MEQGNKRRWLHEIYKQVGVWIVLAVLVLGGAGGFLMGQTAPKKAAPDKKAIPDRKVADDKRSSEAETGTPATGRYQIIFNPNVRADTFLLDTQTGKTWVHTTISDVKGHPTIWVNEERLDSDQAFIDWTRQQVLIPASSGSNAK